MALKDYMKKRHLSGHKSSICDSDGNLLEELAEKAPKKKNVEKKTAKKEKKRSYLDV